MRRVVHVVESLDRGGLERVVCNLAMAQRRAGLEPSVICLFREGLLAAELREAGIAVHDARRAGKSWPAALWRLRRLLRRLAPEIIHTHNATAHYYAALATLAGPWVPLLNSRHGMGAVNAGDARERLFRLSLPRTAGVVAVCEAARRQFLARRAVPVHKSWIVPNGIDVTRFRVVDKMRGEARASLGLAPDVPVAGTVGRLNWAKDHDLLLQAWAIVAQRDPRARLLVIGDGELRAALARRAAELGVAGSVSWLLDRGDVEHLLQALDLFVLSSRTEGYSMALLEAAAAGLPAVATDVGGNGEIVRDGVTGWIHNWKKRGWKTADKKPVKNVELWQRLDAARERHDVHWKWVKGHADDEMNERADELARAGMAPYIEARRAKIKGL